MFWNTCSFLSVLSVRSDNTATPAIPRNLKLKKELHFGIELQGLFMKFSLKNDKWQFRREFHCKFNSFDAVCE